jgi:cobalt-zinc-cadmium efflux system outer membrane protein
MNAFHSLLAIGLLLAPGALAADGENQRIIHALLAKPLSADRAARIALLNNPQLQASFEESGIDAAGLLEARLLQNPSFSLALRFPDRAPSATDAEEAVAFDVLDLFLRPLRESIAANRLQATEWRVAHEGLALVAEVKNAVYALEADSQLLDQVQAVQETAAAALDLTQKQHAAGNVTDLAVLEQQASYSQARLDSAMAAAALNAQREKINRLLGLWGKDTGWKASGTLPPLPAADPPLEGLESRAVSQRLDLAAAQASLRGVVQALGLTKSYRWVGALEFGIDTEHNPDHSNVTGPTFRFELPVFQHGQARIAKGEAELRRAERQFAGLAIDIRSTVHGELLAKRETARFYQEELLPERTAILQQTQIQYNGMLAGNYVLFAAKAEQLRAQSGGVEALRDYWIARANLELAAGGRLTGKITSPTHQP